MSQTLIGFGHVIPFFVLLIPLVRPNLALFGVEWTRASSFHFGSRASKLARVVCVLARIFLYIMEELDPALFTEGGFARGAYQPLLLGGLDVVAASTPVGHHTCVIDLSVSGRPPAPSKALGPQNKTQKHVGYDSNLGSYCCLLSFNINRACRQVQGPRANK